ncbi:unnamed protein product, partial [Larinioides sclopetarius]
GKQASRSHLHCSEEFVAKVNNVLQIFQLFWLKSKGCYPYHSSLFHVSQFRHDPSKLLVKTGSIISTVEKQIFEFNESFVQ